MTKLFQSFLDDANGFTWYSKVTPYSIHFDMIYTKKLPP